MKALALLLRGLSLMVPWLQREAWREEWFAEVWYCRHVHRREWWKVVRFAAGAVRDAFELWRNSSAQRDWSGVLIADSPWTAIAGLSGLSAVLLAAMWCTGTPDVAWRQPGSWPRVVPLLVALLIIALLQAKELVDLRRKKPGFFVLKLTLALCVSFCLSNLVSSLWGKPGPEILMMVANTVALRWALRDELVRCPVCLRRMRNPISIGQASQTLLVGCGREIICPHGHGTMSLPELVTPSYLIPRWREVEPGWEGYLAKPKA